MKQCVQFTTAMPRDSTNHKKTQTMRRHIKYQY